MLDTSPPTAVANRFFAPLMSVVALGIVVQSALAGVFLQGGSRDRYATYITVHGVVADVTTAAALGAVALALRARRRDRPLTGASVGLVVLLLAESLLGHLINGSIGGSDHDTLTIVHIPLALAILVLTVWLLGRARRLRRGAS